MTTHEEFYKSVIANEKVENSAAKEVTVILSLFGTDSDN